MGPLFMNPTSQLLKAAIFAARKHGRQSRKGRRSEPYIVHPLEVARLLKVVGGVDDIDTLTAAILHDTVEDTDTTIEEIGELFGENVASIVSEVTDDEALPKMVRKEKQVEHAPFLSDAAKRLKMCDKISNISDVLSDPAVDWSDARRREYVNWGVRVFEGLRGANADLEDYFDKLVEKARREI